MSTLQRFAGGLLLAAALFGCGSESPTAPPADLATASAAAVYTQVVAGGRHTCAIASNGRTYCWGIAALGAGTVFQSSKPVRVLGNLGFVQISAGTEHTCGVTAENRAYCWGDNTYGQVGDGTSENSRSTPVAVAGGHRFRHIRAGGHHSCAIDLNNKLFCWGDNTWGQLGTGNNVARTVPTRVLGGLTIKTVIAGYEHTCAVTTTAKGYCWGSNQEGQLGTGKSQGRSLTPAAVAGGLSWKNIVAGTDHSCGITTTADKGYCWGGLSDDNNGQLGNGGFVGTRAPVAVAGTRHWRQVNAGYLHTCGVTLANVAFCWGFNSSGQNGDGGKASVSEPTRVSGNIPFLGIAVGVGLGDTFATYTCGITTDGRVFCWGLNANGQLGNGTSLNTSLTPVQALPPT